jgi:hypothetical protein
MKRKAEKYFEFLAFSILVVSFIIFLFYYNFQKNTGIDDSSAIFGGKDEYGYLSAGYLVSFETKNSVRSCGLFYLDNTTAVTAAHCVEKGGSFFVGEKNFSYLEDENIQVNEVIIHPKWDGKNRNYDIAIVKFVPHNFETAIISDIELGCGYEIVGYGSTEIDSVLEPGVRLRKSYSLCIDGFSDNVLYISGETGGVCFGDSGSPIFKSGTNRVVGILSAVYTLPGENDKYCAIGNNAVAVRLSKFKEYIENYKSNNPKNKSSLCSEFCISDSDCSEGLACVNNQCTNLTGSCTAKISEYCSLESGIVCEKGSSCFNNRCVEKTTVLTTNQSSDKSLTLNLNQNNFIDNYKKEIFIVVGIALVMNALALIKIGTKKN